MTDSVRSSMSGASLHSRFFEGMERSVWVALIRDEFARQSPHAVLWWPVFFACGIGAFFTLPFDPPPLSGVIVLALAVGLRAAVLPSSLGARISLVAMLMAAGFCAAQLRTFRVAAPVLVEEIGPVMVSGTVIIVEPDGSASRVTLNRLSINRLSQNETPERVRLRIPGSHGAPRIGDLITVRAVVRAIAFGFVMQRRGSS